MSETFPTYWTCHAAATHPLAFYDALLNKWTATNAPTVENDPLLMGVNMATWVYPGALMDADGTTVTTADPAGTAVSTHCAMTSSNTRALLLSPVRPGATIRWAPNLRVVVLRLVASDENKTRHDHVAGFNGMNSYTRTLTSVSTELVVVPQHEEPRVYGNVGVVGIKPASTGATTTASTG
ncbi:MAG TPA: hypothetical protein VNP72_01720, partial [Longimicrobium sp.]|nr:hypothetical protein [Longimicrobium sp.]